MALLTKCELYVHNKREGRGFMTNKTCHKNRGTAEVYEQFLFVINSRPTHNIVFRFNSEMFRIIIKLLFCNWPFVLSVFLQTSNGNTSSHTTSSVRCWSFKTLSQRCTCTHLRMIQDHRQAYVCESIAFHVWYRHACVKYVLFAMWSKLWIDIFVLMMFLRKEDFSLPVFFSAHNEGKPGRQVCMIPGLSEESCGPRVFGRGVPDATLVDGRIFFTLFPNNRREFFAELKFGELLPRRLWEWQRCKRAVSRDPVHVFSFWRKQCFFSGKTMTNKERFCCYLELKKLEPFRQRKDQPHGQGLEPLPDGWWKCVIYNDAKNLRDPMGAVERTFSC